MNYILEMTILQKQFFQLVQAGLWGTTAEATLFDEQTDWKRLYQVSRTQAMLGIVFDGIQTLPSSKQPPRNIYLQWCNVVIQIEETNRLLNKELANVYSLLRQNGVDPILLKGQGVAQNYLNPLHRHCGDIDFYVGQKDYNKANQLLSQEGTRGGEELYKHADFNWHGVIIENHRILTELSDPVSNRRLQTEIKRWHGSTECRKRKIGEVEVTLAPLPFDTAYVLIHAVQHFLNEGIGLRQVCDWACMLHAQNQLPGKEETAKLLKEFGMEQAARAFGVIAVLYLGLQPEALPIAYGKQDLSIGNWLLNDIWQGGNFGKYSSQIQKRPKGYWEGKWYTFTRILARSRKLKALAPAEVRWLPIALIRHSLQIQWKRLTGKSY